MSYTANTLPTYKDEISRISLLTADCLSAAEKTDKRNFSAMMTLGRQLKSLNEEIKNLQGRLRTDKKAKRVESALRSAERKSKS